MSRQVYHRKKNPAMRDSFRITVRLFSCSLRMTLGKIHKAKMSVHLIAYQSDRLSHRKSCQNRTDSKSFNMSKQHPCHTRGCCQTDHIKRNLDSGIFYFGNRRQLAWKQICRNDWQATSVRKRDSNTNQQIADHKI